MKDLRTDSAETQQLLDAAAAGDALAAEKLIVRYRSDLVRSVSRRLDARVSSRLDPSDVVQEAQADVVERLQDYLARRPMPFRLWLVKTAYERMLKAERRHLNAACRAVDREIPLPDRSSAALANQLTGRFPTPSEAAIARESAIELRRALAKLSELDRQVLMLRNFEGLNNAEVSSVLEISPEAAKKRYARALLRLRRLVTTHESRVDLLRGDRGD